MVEQQASNDTSDQDNAVAAGEAVEEEPDMNETVKAFLRKLEAAKQMDIDAVDPSEDSEQIQGSQDLALPHDAQESDQPATPATMAATPNMQDFMKQLYENEGFQEEKQSIENQISRAAQVTIENKNFMGEMDSFLKDLESWKQTRDVQQQQ